MPDTCKLGDLTRPLPFDVSTPPACPSADSARPKAMANIFPMFFLFHQIFRFHRIFRVFHVFRFFQVFWFFSVYLVYLFSFWVFWCSGRSAPIRDVGRAGRRRRRLASSGRSRAGRARCSRWSGGSPEGAPWTSRPTAARRHRPLPSCAASDGPCRPGRRTPTRPPPAAPCRRTGRHVPPSSWTVWSAAIPLRLGVSGGGDGGPCARGVEFEQEQHATARWRFGRTLRTKLAVSVASGSAVLGNPGALPVSTNSGR